MWFFLLGYFPLLSSFVSLFFGGFTSYSRISLLVWRRHHYRWRASSFDIYSALMTTEQSAFLSVPLLLWHGHPFIICRAFERGAVTTVYLYLRLRSVADWIRTPNFSHARWTRDPTATPRRFPLRALNFIWRYFKLIFVHRRMIYTAFDRNCPCASFEEGLKF